MNIITTQSVKTRSDFYVTLCVDNCSGSDDGMARAAWAVPPRDSDAWDAVKDLKERYGKDGTNMGIARVLLGCMKLKHNSPFEHGLMSVYAELPGVVWWQLTRQRFMSLDSEDFSFNLESGRYKHLDPEFYIPSKDRPCREPEAFKPMRPELDCDASSYACAQDSLKRVAVHAWDEYQHLLGVGVSREVARLCLPNWSLYCDGYVTARPLSWLQFFSKRNRTSDTAVPTFPQWEIEQFARSCEDMFEQRWPITHAAFVGNGRQAP